jgi:hypothetical protein
VPEANDDAVTVELGGPTKVAFGCFGATTGFVALIAIAALGYTIAGTGHRVVLGVVAGLLLVIVVILVVALVNAVRHRQALVFDAAGVALRTTRRTVVLPWPEVAVVRVVEPNLPKGMRTSAPRTPSVEVCPADESTVRTHATALAEHVAAGEPPRPDLPGVRFAFRLPSAAAAEVVTAAVLRFAPATWTG